MYDKRINKERFKDKIEAVMRRIQGMLQKRIKCGSRKKVHIT